MKRERPAVFVFSTAYHPLIGGAEIAVQEITRRLAGEFRFFIVTARLKRDLPAVEIRPEGTIIRIGLGTKLDKFLLPFLGVVKVCRILQKEKPVLFWAVMVSYASFIPFFVNFPRSSRTPILLTLQEGDSEAHIRRAKFGLIGLSWRWMLKRAESLSAISTYLENLAGAFGYRGQSVVIPNGVAVEMFGRAFASEDIQTLRQALQILPEEKVIITVSRLEKKNGLDVLIRALPKLKMLAPKIRVRLLIVGDGRERQNLETLAQELGLWWEVNFSGALPYTDIPRYLALANVFCRPARSEGLGSAFLEAMAAGLPVVATAVGGIPDFLHNGENGLFINTDDPGDCAQKILTLLENNALAKKLAKNARETVRKNYQWDSISGRFKTLFERLKASAFKPRLFLATPIFPPAVGGPATHASILARQFSSKGYEVSVLTYGGGEYMSETPFRLNVVSTVIPSGLRHIKYFWEALKMLARTDAVLAFDPLIVGVPVTFAAALLRKPVIFRVEGDFLWEWFLERTKADFTLGEFYEAFPRLEFNLKERLMYALVKWVYGRARLLVFSSEWRKEIFMRGYAVQPGRTAFVPLPWPGVRPVSYRREKVFLFAGRFVHVKNLTRFIRAFARAALQEFQLELIGSGPEEIWLKYEIKRAGMESRITIRPPLARQDFRERLKKVCAFLLPSLSDVSPNIILDCLETGTPFLLTRETGFFETLEQVGVFVDPRDEAGIAYKLKLLADKKFYDEYQSRLSKFDHNVSWDEVSDCWLEIIENTL